MAGTTYKAFQKATEAASRVLMELAGIVALCACRGWALAWARSWRRSFVLLLGTVRSFGASVNNPLERVVLLQDTAWYLPHS
jgi:hypothetical protein